MKIIVKVPATTANLGPGFDALGLALDLWNETEFSLAADGQTSVEISGEGQGQLPTGAENPMVAAAFQVYDLAQQPRSGLRLRCRNRIPLGSGLGSSSAALLSGMLGANALLGYPLSAEAILKRAIQAEGHPDNLAPAMLGGLVASIVHQEQVTSLKLTSQNDRAPLHVTIVLPAFDFPTHQARAILPPQVERADAIYNISRAVLVAEALRLGDFELLGRAMLDRLHQPYRLPLIPGAAAAMQAGAQAGAAAVALSGAGPSLIAFSPGANPDIGAAMQQAFAQAGLRARIFSLKTSDLGAQVSVV